MISTSRDRSDYFYRKEQHARMTVELITAELLQRATQQINARVKHYPPGMRLLAPTYIKDLHRDMCKESIARNEWIGKQQHYLRLAEAYAARAIMEEVPIHA